MSTVDDKVDRLADKLQQLARRSATEGGVKAKLAGPLAADADLVRKLKPSLIKARARGEAPTSGPSGGTAAGPSVPQLPRRPKQKASGGPNPWVVAGVCLVAGIALAKWIDWRGHAHPRD
jgi:hypothetical protein